MKVYNLYFNIATKNFIVAANDKEEAEQRAKKYLFDNFNEPSCMMDLNCVETIVGNDDYFDSEIIVND